VLVGDGAHNTASIQIHQFEDKQVVVAEIPELDPAQKPCFYIGAGMTKGSFVRVSDGDRHLSAYEVQIMLSSRGQPRDDEPAPASRTLPRLALTP
jgi:ATP-dependent DNA helicase RecG